jgi:hypothetical protein
MENTAFRPGINVPLGKPRTSQVTEPDVPNAKLSTSTPILAAVTETGRVDQGGKVRSLLGPHRIGAALAIVVFFWSWVFMGHWFYGRHAEIVGQNHDTVVYQGYAAAMRTGQLPYRDFSVVYPPGGLPVLLAPAYAVSAGDIPGYQKWFAREMAVSGLLCLLFVLAARPPARAVAFVAVSPLLIGSIVLSRFDLLAAALVAGAVAALLRDRHELGFVALGAAFAVKLFAIVVLPVAIVWTLRRTGRRSLGRAVASWLIVVAAAFGPFLILASDGLRASLKDQASRAIQIESLPGTVLMTLGHPAEIVSLGAVSLAGHHTVVIASTVIEIAVLFGLWLGFERGEPEPDRLVRYFAACVCAFVALGKVFSPQYLIWLVPLVPLVRGRRGLIATALLAGALILTQWYFPDHYSSVMSSHLAWLVLLRNLLLVGLLAVLGLPAPTGKRSSEARARGGIAHASARTLDALL